MDFICAKCNEKMDKTPTLLSIGCQNCGPKVFKTVKSTLKETLGEIRAIRSSDEQGDLQYDIIPQVIQADSEEKRMQDLEEDHIPAIKLKEKGVYEVNIDGLFRDSREDPIVLSGKAGIYRVEFLAPNKKEEKS